MWESCYQSDYLAHFGIPGMKWGRRRYQNEDGTLASAGKARYGSGESRSKWGDVLMPKKSEGKTSSRKPMDERPTSPVAKRRKINPLVRENLVEDRDNSLGKPWDEKPRSRDPWDERPTSPVSKKPDMSNPFNTRKSLASTNKAPKTTRKERKAARKEAESKYTTKDWVNQASSHGKQLLKGLGASLLGGTLERVGAKAYLSGNEAVGRALNIVGKVAVYYGYANQASGAVGGVRDLYKAHKSAKN